VRHMRLCMLLIWAVLFSGSAAGAGDRPPQTDDFILYPSALDASGGTLCGAPDYDLMFTLGEEVVGASDNAQFQLWSGFRFDRRVTVLCPRWTAIDEFEQSEIRETMLHSAHPNPVTGQLRMQYDLADRGNVRLAVYDVRGREIRVFDKGQLEPGRYELTWDGNDSDGKIVPTGVYFVRLTVGDSKFVNRVVAFR